MRKNFVMAELKRICALSAAAVMLMMSLSGCGQLKYDMDYKSASNISSFQVAVGERAGTAKSFASDLCVVSADVMDAAAVDTAQAEAAALFDVNGKEVIYSKNAHERLHPASLTKVMTALVALKYGSLDQVLTATDAVKITESGAQLCGLKAGDTMTLDQALHILLMYSANDVANLIAENIGGGSVDHFVELMNEEAASIGATNTHFTNPHGLTNEDHYTTAYDLYLIFNEAAKYDTFCEIIQMSSYQTVYYDGNGRAIEKTINSTNRFVKEEQQAPANISVIGGKTGTTAAAGHCLILLAKDTSGAPYISVILKAESNDYLYQTMTELLNEINK